MPSHDICQDAKVSLALIHSLKQAFDHSFASALSSGQTKDIEQAQKNKQKFEEKMSEVRMQIRALEKKFVKTHELAISTSLFRKKDTGEHLTKFELFVLYEFDTLSRFGLSRSRIDWRMTRNHEDDLSIMFDEFSHEIARSFDEITPQTQIYIGKLDEPDFFQRIPNSLELIYTAFPEKRIHRHDIKIGGKDVSGLETLLGSNGHRIYGKAKSIMEHEDFERSLRVTDPAESDWTKWKLKLPEEITLIRLCVADLGFPTGATMDEIYARALELGLELCTPEVGPQFRLQYAYQPDQNRVCVGMEPIFNSDGNIGIFSVERFGNTSWLWNSETVGSWTKWSPDSEFVFHLRKQSH